MGLFHPSAKEDESHPDDASQLLGRSGFPSRLEGAESYADRVVLISGAGGSIGSELSRQVLACRPRKIILFELSEAALYLVHQTIDREAVGTNIEVVPVLGSVTDERKIRNTLCNHAVQVVLHAAAYKHVPLVELNPLAGLQNNVVGTQILVNQAVATGVERFVLISSDKAVRPINVMGASKRFCELIVQDVSRRLSKQNGPVFSIVRFGNVLGSSGSVLPLFRDQVRRGGPVTVTHPDVSRFFMTVQEAVHLVLHAGSMALGGEVFVLDMGEPVKIEALARRVIHSAGYSVRDEDNLTGDIQLKFIGLRRGEKLQEELTVNGRRAVTSHPRIFTAIEARLIEFEVAAALRALRWALANEDEAGARANACHWVEGIGEVVEDGIAPPKGKHGPGCAVSVPEKAQRSRRLRVECS
ncbi:UDP-N-acetylglucosamine 4,6-dehydratase family protein [Tateyamaria sp.]|uniref:UDP-N-acetylglucosamine 4,6-dehydratase family protein n=1 Tax=Tateyamaria sp. TaxID=1929288 RepID=UPI0039B95329